LSRAGRRDYRYAVPAVCQKGNDAADQLGFCRTSCPERHGGRTMGYFLRAGLGLALFVAGLVVFNMKLQELLDIGTCASGNVQFQITQECPEGTGSAVLLVMISAFVCIIGGVIFAFRGDPPSGRRRGFSGSFGSTGFLWGAFFTATGVALLVGRPYGEVLDPATGEIVGRPDSQLGATITGVTFLVMGVPALLIALGLVVKSRSRAPKPASATAPFTAPSLAAPAPPATAPMDDVERVTDRIGQLERLQRLRDAGVLTHSEFEIAKAEILDP
jgi:hypothetical protein